MNIELKIPPLGESITEVEVGEWLKSEGDMVEQDEPVVVIDSEKSTFDLPAPHKGRLTKIVHQTGERIKIGELIAELEDEGGAVKRLAGDKTVETAESAPSSVTPQTSAIKDRDMFGTSAEPNQPEAKTTAKPHTTEGTTPANNQIETAPPEEKIAEPSPTGTVKPKEHLEESAEPKPTQPAYNGNGRREETVPMTMLRRTAAQRLVEARQTMAMLTTFNEVDMSVVQALRKEHKEAFEKRYRVKLGLMSFFVKAAIDALEQFPRLNAEIREENIVYRNFYDLGVAVSTDRGLVVPVLRNAERLTFAELEESIADFAERAKTGRLKPDELDGGTFTITNGGVFGSLLSTPIINPPQSGILGLHSIQERPVALQGQVVIRPMMYIALTYDHRLVDGREAVSFLRRVKETIENPARLLLQI